MKPNTPVVLIPPHHIKIEYADSYSLVNLVLSGNGDYNHSMVRVIESIDNCISVKKLADSIFKDSGMSGSEIEDFRLRAMSASNKMKQLSELIDSMFDD